MPCTLLLIPESWAAVIRSVFFSSARTSSSTDRRSAAVAVANLVVSEIFSCTSSEMSSYFSRRASEASSNSSARLSQSQEASYQRQSAPSEGQHLCVVPVQTPNAHAHP